MLTFSADSGIVATHIEVAEVGGIAEFLVMITSSFIISWPTLLDLTTRFVRLYLLALCRIGGLAFLQQQLPLALQCLLVP